MSKLILFDVDGTLVESAQNLKDEMILLLNGLYNSGFELGIVGGGNFEKIYTQTKGVKLMHIFAESGCVYKKFNPEENIFEEVYTKNIREHHLYPSIDILIKSALQFLSNVEYPLTGHFIDLRNGLIYISCIGMQANYSERQNFIKLDSEKGYRLRLLNILREKAKELDIDKEIDILEGGSVGIGVYPKEWGKTQVLEYLPNDKYSEIYYFGDKYTPEGNDYLLLNHPRIKGFPVNNPKETYDILQGFKN